MSDAAANAKIKEWVIKEKHITIGFTSVLLVVIIVISSMGLAAYSMYNKTLPPEQQDKMTSTNLAYVLVFSMMLILAVVSAGFVYAFASRSVIFPGEARLRVTANNR